MPRTTHKICSCGRRIHSATSTYCWLCEEERRNKDFDAYAFARLNYLLKHHPRLENTPQEKIPAVVLRRAREFALRMVEGDVPELAQVS